MRQYTMFFILLLFLVGCCNKTMVVLVPDEQGNVGEVEVTGTKGSVRISEAWCATKIGASGEPGKVKELDKEKVDKIFCQALDTDPVVPLEYRLYFLSGSASLLPESMSELPSMVETILLRKNYEITIIGHTDRTGDDASNLRLSKKRTQAVKNLLIEYGIPLAELENISHYGESVPLVPTADGVAEPRNRRVEIFVR